MSKKTNYVKLETIEQFARMGDADYVANRVAKLACTGGGDPIEKLNRWAEDTTVSDWLRYVIRELKQKPLNYE